MDPNEKVCVAEYVSRPYEQVCTLLETWTGRPLSAEDPSSAHYFLGDLLRVSRSVARLPVTRLGAAAADAELRVLPVTTGRNSVTELLLVLPGDADRARDARVQQARALLGTLLRELDVPVTAAAPTDPALLAS